MSRTDQISFFHGTSAHAAAKILRSGWRNIYADLKLQELARDIWSEVLKQTGSPHSSASFFERAGCSRPVDASLLIEKASLGAQKGLMSYGDFFVSMNFRIACNYALFSPTGSELLIMLSEGLKVLRYIREDLELEIMSKYTDAASALKARSYPVVLEVKGIEEQRIAREDGNPDSWPHIELAMRRHLSGFPATFRINDIRREEFVWVHDLRQWSEAMRLDWDWLPDMMDVHVKRASSEVWLTQFGEGDPCD